MERTQICVTNRGFGLKLPFIAISLLITMTLEERLGEFRNKLRMHILGAAIILLTAALGPRTFITVF